MKATGLSQQQQIEAWAEVTIKCWKEKILMLDVWDTGELYESFTHHVVTQSGGDVAKIDFMFKLYGIYASLGVGREVSRDNPGDLGFTPERKKKPWYGPVFYREVMKLKEFLAYRYGQESVKSITNMLGDVSKGTQKNYERQQIKPSWQQWLKERGE